MMLSVTDQCYPGRKPSVTNMCPGTQQDKPPENPPTNFPGFEQSLTDNVVELTKVMNTLKIKLDNFQSIQILIPKHTQADSQQTYITDVKLGP